MLVGAPCQVKIVDRELLISDLTPANKVGRFGFALGDMVECASRGGIMGD